MEKISNYIESNRDRFIEELFGLIRIPSISAAEANKHDMVRAAEYIRDMLLGNGADRAEVYPTRGHPIVYGEKIIAFVVASRGVTLSEQEIINFMKTETSSFKVPSKIHFLEALPKTPVGKILKRELRKKALSMS